MRDENMIAALKRERAGYVARGLDDRVAQVDEQLKSHGYDGVQDPAAEDIPHGRTAGEQQTADADDKPAAGARRSTKAPGKP